MFSSEGRVSQSQTQSVDIVLNFSSLDLVVGLRGEEKCVHIEIDYSPFWRAPRLPRLVSFWFQMPPFWSCAGRQYQFSTVCIPDKYTVVLGLLESTHHLLQVLRLHLLLLAVVVHHQTEPGLALAAPLLQSPTRLDERKLPCFLLASLVPQPHQLFLVAEGGGWKRYVCSDWRRRRKWLTAHGYHQLSFKVFASKQGKIADHVEAINQRKKWLWKLDYWQQAKLYTWLQGQPE